MTPAASAAAMAVQAVPAAIPPGLHRFELPIRDEATLREFIAAAFGITIPDRQVCPHHSTPWRAFADAYFARSPVAIWKASRGFGGKSFLLSLLGLTEALTLGADTNVLGGSGEQSERVLEHMTTLMTRPNAPRHALAGEVEGETRLANGSQVRSLMASSRSVRGPHPQRLRIDEADECDLAIVDAALGQPMGRDDLRANTVLSSTHHYADGTMTELLRRGAERDWQVHEWCLEETRERNGGWLREEQIEATRATVSEATWNAEILLQEPSPENRAIVTEKVRAMFDRGLGVFPGVEGKRYAFVAAVPGAKYVTAADWGRDVHWSVFTTWRTDVRPMELVCFQRRGREPYPVMVAAYDEQCGLYNSRDCYDGTGIGKVIRDLSRRRAAVACDFGDSVWRANMLESYVAAIEGGRLRAPFVAYMESEHRLAQRKDVFSSYGSGHLPDSIASGALAYWLASRPSMTVGVQQ